MSLTTSEKPQRLAVAAEFLGVSVKTIRRLIQRGSLRPFKIGGQWFVMPSEIQRYINHQTARAGTR